MMSGIRVCRSVYTWAAVVGDGFPEALADGAASGSPDSEQRASAIGCSGSLAANVGCPAVTDGESREFGGSGSSIVSGPGQNFAMSGS